MYLFHFSIDATQEDGSLGRLINHDIPGNVYPKLVNEKNEPKIRFFARATINKGDQIFYDYGEKRPNILEKHPWLKPKNPKAQKPKSVSRIG